MLQLHIIADKSEILPQKPRKRQGKKQRETSESGEHDEYDFTEDEPVPSSSGLSKAKKPFKTKQRKIVRTPLDVGTVRALLSQIDLEKFQQVVDWLKECLEDAAEDTEEAAEEEDGVPIVPLLELQKEAIEDANFKKVLIALGMQPPVFGMENYWRIPTYLNSADLKLRAQIVAGEEVLLDVEDNDSEAEDNGQHSEGDESEEDYLEVLGIAKERKKLENLESYMDQRREKMKSLVYSKSDDETEERAPLKSKKKEVTAEENEKQKKKKVDYNSDEDVELVNQIKHKLDKKKRNYDLSSDDEDNDEDTFKIPLEMEQLKPSTSQLFDQLKTKRAESETNTEDTVMAADDGIDGNFNSEDFRKRLAELSDEDDDDDENKNVDNKHTLNNRPRRFNVIESDTDDENENEDEDAVDNVNKQALKDDGDGDDNNELVHGDVDDGVKSIKKQKQPGDNMEEDYSSETITRKRQRSVDADNENENEIEEDDEDAGFLKRKKPSPSKQRNPETGEEPAKRRRVNIIDDDDDDY